MENGKGSRGSSVLKGEPVSVMSGDQVTEVEDCSYHDVGVGVRGKWEAGLESGSRICGPLPPGNISPPVSFYLSLILCPSKYECFQIQKPKGVPQYSDCLSHCRVLPSRLPPRFWSYTFPWVQTVWISWFPQLVQQVENDREWVVIACSDCQEALVILIHPGPCLFFLHDRVDQKPEEPLLTDSSLCPS